jgi:ribosomal protein S18 acetylase RimI-like enzyme
MEIALRRLAPEDSIEALTALLHRAYAAHAADGRRFFASYQAPADTRHRVSKGECWVATAAGELVGTVTLVSPYDFPVNYPAPAMSGTFYQLAVDPTRQRSGLGSALLRLAEERIEAAGASAIAIDTSALAVELIAWYERRGYTGSGAWRWAVTNYASVVLTKVLPRRL